MTDEQEDEKGCNLPQRASQTIVFLEYFYFVFLVLLLYFVSVLQLSVFVLHVYRICIVLVLYLQCKKIGRVQFCFGILETSKQ